MIECLSLQALGENNVCNMDVADITSLGSILTSLTTDDINCLPLNDVNLMTAIGSTGGWSTSKVNFVFIDFHLLLTNLCLHIVTVGLIFVQYEAILCMLHILNLQIVIDGLIIVWYELILFIHVMYL